MGFRQIFRQQLRMGTTVALAVGSSVGALLGVGLINLDTVYFILPDTSARIWAILFLCSSLPIVLSSAIIPLELLFSTALMRWPTKWNFKTMRFHLSLLLIGCLFLFAFFWFSFNVIRNPRSLPSLLIYLLLAIVSLFILLATGQSQNVRSLRSGIRPRTLLCLILISTITAFVSYHFLSRVPALSGSNSSVPIVSLMPAKIPESEKRLNVILISIDTLRPDHLGLLHYPKPTSPNLDRLAKSGIVFETAYSHSPWTLPSHATMLTSLYSSIHGARFSSQHAPILDKLDEKVPTIPEIFRTAGYRTAAYTSTFWLSKPWGLDQGFIDFQMSPSDTASQIIDKALKWIEQNQKRPFFLFLHFYDVHNYRSPKEFEEQFQDLNYDGKLKGKDLKTSVNGYYRLSEQDLKYVEAKYDGAIKYVDAELGRLFNWLRLAGLDDHTAIAVTSDHGEEFWEHGGTGHGFTLYDEIIRVPLILQIPGEEVNQGKRINERVGIIDIGPTLLDYAALQPNPSFQGVSLKQLIMGVRSSPRTLLAEDTYFLNTYAVMDGNYKYIDNQIPPGECLNPALFFVNLRSFFKFRGSELYDLRKDPRERQNLLRNESQQAKKMRDSLLTHIRIENVGEQTTIEETTQEQLRSLGYIQ